MRAPHGIVLLGVLTIASGCTMPSDPVPSVVGVRWEEDRLVAFLPVCPGDRLESVQIYDETDPAVRNSMPSPIWTGSSPRDPATLAGEFVLNGENAFAQSTGPFPARLPADIAVEYKTARGRGAAMRVRAAEVPRGGVPADTYWTTDGTKSREQLLKQFPCDQPSPAASTQ